MLGKLSKLVMGHAIHPLLVYKYARPDGLAYLYTNKGFKLVL